MSVEPNVVGEAGGGPDSYHCLELFDLPPHLASGLGKFGGPDQKNVEKRILSSLDGPFAKDRFAAFAPISPLEEILAMSFLFLCMGMPLIWMLAVVPSVLVLGGMKMKLAIVLATLFLAMHPLPKAGDARFQAEVRQSRLAFALYKYFSYRFVWRGDALRRSREVGPWLGAGVPHGVLPFANLLSMLGINSFAFLPNVFKGAPASVVFHTPFLRYLLFLGPCCDVGAKSLARELGNGVYIGLVPDGIAGIFKCNANDETIYLKERRGLAKLALRTGCALLPAYSMGNTEAFTPWFDGLGIMESLSRKTQASLFFYTGRFGLPLGIPRRTRITMLVGDPIVVARKESPSAAEVNDVHERLLAGIRETFDAHKHAMGWGHKQMKFV